MSAAIVGREDELAAIGRFLSRDDWPRTLLLEGEAGAGKTTLWLDAVEAAQEHFHVLIARPLETEAKLAYSGVGDLLDGVHESFGELPAPQAHALRSALLLEAPSADGVDQRGVMLGFLGVLRALATARPVMVAVDDVQWLDGASSWVLASAGRRLGEERVAFVLALRTAERSRLPFAPERDLPRFDRLSVGNLSLSALHRLLQDRLGLVLARPALRTVHETSRGNPFFALELARAADERRDAQLAVEPLPPSLHELVAARIATMPRRTRAAMLVAAALADPTLELIGAVTGDDGAASLAPALKAELVTVASGRVRFTHPLLTAAAYGAAGPSERRDVHAALAARVRDPEERARHLALAAVGPDAGVAGALDEAAQLARARGAPGEAAELLEEARRLTLPDGGAEALRRAVAAAGHHFEAGDARRARVLLDEAIPELPAGVERARALIVLARVRSYDDDIRAAVKLLEEAVTEGAAEPLVQGRAHEILSGIFFRLRERLAEAIEHARAALAVSRELGDPELAAAALGSLVLAEAAHGAEQAPATLAAADAVGSSGRGTRAMGGAEFQVAVVRMWWDQLDEAQASFERMLAFAEEIGDESSVPYIRVLLAQTACLRGRFDDAAAHADEGALRAEQVGQETLVAYALALAALAAAHRGDEDAARSAGARALDLAGATSGRPAEHFATAALGLLELSLGRNAEAVDVLTPLVAFARQQELREPGQTRFVPDLVEALAACERLEEARDQLAWFEANAERLGRASGQGAAARCRGFLAGAEGDLPAAIAAFESALAHHERVPLPFDRARTLLALGVARRRANDRRLARATLEEARAMFGSLGAAIWEQRAVEELGRIGGRAPASGELTPVERRVVELVAAGRTNREVAAALFLSTRTVEGHLSHAYGKLGVRSRVELARKLAGEAGKVG
jgi:ATP/maltotriose-dependent transcriptional regulator MalT